MGKPRTAWDHPVSSSDLADPATRRACNGKTRFPSKKNATARAKAIGGTMNAYRCRFCRHWHIGHSSWTDTWPT